MDGMSKIIYKMGEKFGWVVDVNGRSCPHFFCSVTGKPINSENPGTLYWNPRSGESLILSDLGEDQSPSVDLASFNSMAIDMASFYLFQNSTPQDKAELEERIKFFDQI